MTAYQFRQALLARPFRPFRIRMADGRTFEVKHPEHAAMTGGGRLAFIADHEDGGSFIDLLLMTELQFEEHPFPSSSSPPAGSSPPEPTTSPTGP